MSYVDSTAVVTSLVYITVLLYRILDWIQITVDHSNNVPVTYKVQFKRKAFLGLESVPVYLTVPQHRPRWSLHARAAARAPRRVP